MSEMTVGIRELKRQLSAYIRQVKAGGTVIITERGTPVGRIVPLSPSLETRIEALIEAGFLAWNGRKLTPLAPMARVRGQRTVADLLLEDRE
jgi:prevent-host-death family protein